MHPRAAGCVPPCCIPSCPHACVPRASRSWPDRRSDTGDWSRRYRRADRPRNWTKTPIISWRRHKPAAPPHKYWSWGRWGLRARVSKIGFSSPLSARHLVNHLIWVKCRFSTPPSPLPCFLRPSEARLLKLLAPPSPHLLEMLLHLGSRKAHDRIRLAGKSGHVADRDEFTALAA